MLNFLFFLEAGSKLCERNSFQFCRVCQGLFELWWAALSLQNTTETHLVCCVLKSLSCHHFSFETKLLTPASWGFRCSAARWHLQESSEIRMNTLLTSLNFLQDLIFNTYTGTLFYLFRLFLTNQVEEKAKFDGIFESLLPVNGLLSGDKVKPVLMNSKLPLDILGRVSMLFRFQLFSLELLVVAVLNI